MPNKYPYYWLFLLITVLSAVTPLTAVHAESFQLDFDSVQTGTQEQRGADWIFEGGLRPLQTAGATNTIQEQTIGVSAYCGDGVKESGEECDGTDLGAATCESNGFSQGSLSCTSLCTLSTAGCSTEPAATVTTGGGGGGGGGGRQNPSAQNVQGPSEISTPAMSIENPQPSAPSVEQGEPKRTATLQSAAPKITVALLPGESPASSSPEATAGKPAVGEALSSVPEAKESRSQESPVANAVALGGMSLSEAGILGRLAWMARFKSLYGFIPAFLS